MAANWSGLVKLCLGNEREKKRGSQTLKPVGPRRFSNAFTVPTVRPVMRYMPTYRLEPKVLLNREICLNEMKKIMIDQFSNFQYTAKHSQSKIAHICEEIKVRVKSKNFDRYRYVCVLTIGEKCMQGYSSMINFLWDAERDGYISYIHDTPDYFAVATLYYLYYD